MWQAHQLGSLVFTTTAQIIQMTRTMLEELLNTRPAKRVRLTTHEIDNHKSDDIILKHPLGVRPSGNAYTALYNAKEKAGFFVALPDELLAQLLEYLSASDLLKLGGTCRALHAFTRNEELWRALFVE